MWRLPGAAQRGGEGQGRLNHQTLQDLPRGQGTCELSLIELFGEGFFKLLRFDFSDAGEPNGEPVPLHLLDKDDASQRLSAHDRPD